MRAINLDTYSLSLLTAKEDILNPRASTNWALFAYEGITNNLKLFDSGAGGLPELVGKFHSSRPMYGLSRLGLTETGQPQIVMICWVGDDVEECRRTECAVHVPLIKTFFTEAQIFITASKQEEITEEKIRDAIAKIRPPERLRRPSRVLDNEDTVGTNYQKTNAAMEIRRINRDSFWARAEREEEQRKEEERRRAMENRRRWEKERVLQEKKEAEERDRKMNEKLQMIEEQRRIQAQVEAESRKEEKARWEQQQREHEEDMRARLRRSESIEKAAEAAVLVSQRSINPREFFRQLSASSQSPGPPRSGKSPFRRYQRSLTDTAFIFERANSSSSPTSPLSPSVNSPFFRSSSTASPISPSYRTFHSPENTHKTPPISRHTSAPPLSPTTLPISRISPIQPSPAPTSSEEEPPSSESPQSTQNQDRPESFTFNQQEPVIPSPKPPDSISETPLHTIESAVGLCAKAVLVEEDDEDEEELEESSIPQFMKSNEEAVSEKSVTSPFVDAEEKDQESEDESHCQSASESEELQGNMENCGPGLVEIVVQTSEDEDKDDEDHDGDDEYENELSNNQELRMNESEYDFMPEEDEDSTRPINGTEEYVDVSEQSTPERYCYIVNREDTIDTHETDGLIENGQPSPERLLRVRALYDYIAEDETELSFKPGDIISDVEAIDKAWWKGSGKDGHHGLFPANYVETI